MDESLILCTIKTHLNSVYLHIFQLLDYLHKSMKFWFQLPCENFAHSNFPWPVASNSIFIQFYGARFNKTLWTIFLFWLYLYLNFIFKLSILRSPCTFTNTLPCNCIENYTQKSYQKIYTYYFAQDLHELKLNLH